MRDRTSPFVLVYCPMGLFPDLDGLSDLNDLGFSLVDGVVFPVCSGRLNLGFPLLLFLLLHMCASLCLLLLSGVLFFHLLNDPPVSLIYTFYYTIDILSYIYDFDLS